MIEIETEIQPPQLRRSSIEEVVFSYIRRKGIYV